MTIEQKARKLSESLKAMRMAINDVDANRIYVMNGRIDVFILDKTIFKDIAADRVDIIPHSVNREFFQVCKYIDDVCFFVLIKDESVKPDTLVPSDITRKAKALL